MRRTPDSLGNRVIGYLGGIDMNAQPARFAGPSRPRLAPPEQVSNTPSATGVPRRPCPDHRPGRRRRRADLRPPLGPSTAAARPAGTPAARCRVPDTELTTETTRCRRSRRGTSCRSAAAATRPTRPAAARRCRGRRRARRPSPEAIVRGDRAGPRVHLHRGPVLHPARHLHPRAARGVGARSDAAPADRDPDVVGSAFRRHPPPRDVRAAARRSGDRPWLGRPDDRRCARAPSGARQRRPGRQQGPARPAAAARPGRRRDAGDARPAVAAARATSRSGCGSRASRCSRWSVATTCVRRRHAGAATTWSGGPAAPSRCGARGRVRTTRALL